MDLTYIYQIKGVFLGSYKLLGEAINYATVLYNYEKRTDLIRRRKLYEWDLGLYQKGSRLMNLLI